MVLQEQPINSARSAALNGWLKDFRAKILQGVRCYMNLFKPAFKIGAFVMLMWGTAMLVPLLVTWYSWIESRAFIYSAACCFLLAGTLYYLGRGHLQHMQ